MVISDPIGDLLTRLRNAQKANHDSLELPDSKIKREICRILQPKASSSRLKSSPTPRKAASKWFSATGKPAVDSAANPLSAV